MTKFLPGITTYIAVLAVAGFILWLVASRPALDLSRLFLA